MTPPSSAQAALRRLLVILAVTIGVLLYSYGWTVTDIDLEKPQEETRKENVTSAMQELLSPRLFEQDRELENETAAFLIDCATGTAPETPPTSDEPYIRISPTCGVPGDVVTVQAYNFAPNADARIRWVPAEGQRRPREVLETGREEIVLTGTGGFLGTIEVPRIGGSTGQTHQIEFVSAVPSGPVRLSGITNEVLRRMVETIFMALIATSISIPISVVLSFFAAHNLMKPIRLPAGNMMVAIIALPIGYGLGQLLLGRLGEAILNITQGDFDAVTAMLPLVFLMAVGSSTLPGLSGNMAAERVRSLLNQVFAGVAFAIFLAIFGGVALFIGEQLIEFANALRPGDNIGAANWLTTAFADGIGGIGTFLQIVGQLIEILIVPLCGVIGAFTLSSMAGTATTDALRALTGGISYVVGGILGFFAGAILFAAVAQIATTAALMGLLTPFVAALFGKSIVYLIYEHATGRLHQRGVRRTDYLQELLSWVSAIAAFAFTFSYLDVNRAMIDGVLPSLNQTSVFGFEVREHLWRAMTIGALLGGIYGALTGTRMPFMIGDVLYNITRTVLNALRSIEPLIMGLIFVIWVGIGPFAGVLALTLHSIASLGKLYSEQIETIDEGPIEALKATGARHLQTIIYAVVPQIVPPYIAFTMYRWDINVRMSTIIGFVGGGGIGLLLSQQINLLRYRDAGVAVLAIAVVVSILDYASALIREKVV